MTIKNRNDLKSYFVKNAIPTEGNFADLIDSPLIQLQDNIFKVEGEPVSVVAVAGDQKRTLRLYGNYPAANPDWMISLKPAQDPAKPATCRAGLGITDGAGNTRLFIDAGNGRVGLGTNEPAYGLDVVGEVRANGYRGQNSLLLDDYRTVNPSSNVCLHSPGDDRDTWLYRDTADTKSNSGIYHRQLSTAVAGLPGNSIGFIGASKLQAYIGLEDGSGFFSGKLTAGGYAYSAAAVNTPTLEIGGASPSADGTRGGILYLHDEGHVGHQLRYNNGTLYLEATPKYGTNDRPSLSIGGDIAIGGKHAFRGNDGWLRLNQDGAFTEGVHTPSRLSVGGDIVMQGKVAFRGNDGWLRLNQDGAFSEGVHTPSRLSVGGDIVMQGKVAFRGNDGWLRLNQDGAFPLGVHTPGNLTSGALNVGGCNSWGDPGWGNAWFSGGMTVYGGVLNLGEWTLVADKDCLYFKHKASTVARLCPTGDHLLVYQNANGAPPYFYVNNIRDHGFWG